MDRLCIISVKNLIMKSRNFVRRYLFTAWWRHRLDRLRKQALRWSRQSGVIAIVQIMKKRFLQAEEVFRRITLSSRHLLS